MANVNATLLSDKAMKITKETVDDVAGAMGAGYVVRDKSVMDMNGVSVGRLVGELTIPGSQPVAQAAYIVPGKDGAALITFSTTKKRFVRDQAAFDASVRATRGLAEPPSSGIPRWVLSAATGAAIAIGLAINSARQRRTNRRIWASIEPVLRNGPATLQELAEAAGMTGFMSKGKVVLCLQEMTGQARLDVLPAPDGTTRLEKVKHIRYRLRA